MKVAASPPFHSPPPAPRPPVLAAALAVTASSGLAVAIALLAFPAASAATAAPPSCRDALLWPFTAASPWNTPLGASAVFVPARLFDPADPRGASARAFSDFHSDDDYVIATAASDPLVTWFDQGHWGGPATEAAYCSVTGRAVMQLHFPANRTVQMLGNNNAAGLLQPDNRTMLLMQPLYVCEPGAPVLAEASSPPKRVDIFNDTGTLFGHGGSGLSAVGGAIRLGELLPGAPPIRHALKLELFANMFYFRPPDGNRSDCYTWPAIACDGYAFSCATQPLGCYNGTNPLVRPGALLAVPPAQAPALSAKLATAPARALLAALSTYGGYLVDDTYWNSTAICTQHGVADEFAAHYGFNFTVDTWKMKGNSTLWYADLLALFRALAVVTSNAPNAPGGGGAPLAPPPPPFCTW